VGARFFNPDGSPFATCGNGTRCAARFAVDHGLVDAGRFVVDTAVADIDATVTEDGVDLVYRIQVAIAGCHRVDGPDGPAMGWLVQVGLPHFVLPVAAQPDGPIDPICRPIRHLPALGREGANVNLVQLDDRSSGSIRTFERGVEGETLACGSGAMASALALHAADLCEPGLSLRVRGGDALHITVPEEPPAPNSIAVVGLTGPALHIFDGSFRSDP
jgi:diaminopimelate epimerase